MYSARPVVLPEAGLTLLPIRESVRCECFYLGEIPLSTAHCELSLPEGGAVHGAAIVMADDAEFALALAVCDGVLAHRLSGWEQVADLLEHGLAALQHEADVRHTMRERSRVRFSLLNQEEAT